MRISDWSSDVCSSDLGRVLKRFFPTLIAGDQDMSGIKSVAFADAQKVADEVVRRYEAGAFDVAHLFYARFQSALVQEPVGRQIIPVAIDTGAEAAPASAAAVEYEPVDRPSAVAGRGG